MRRRVPHLALTALFVVACAAPVFASPVPGTAGTEDGFASSRAGNDGGRVLATVTGHDDVQVALSRGAAWQGFRARNGAWQVIWNEATGTPHRAFGPSIALPGFADDAASADAAVRAFVAGHPALFGGPGIELRTLATVRQGKVWYVRYQQVVRGIPVLFSDWEFRVGTNGRLLLFGADPRPVPAVLATAPRVVAPVAREVALRGADAPATDRAELGSQLAYVPVKGADGRPTLALAYEATVRSPRPARSQRVLLDATTGDVILRRTLGDPAVTGTVTTSIHPTTPTDLLKTRPQRNAKINAIASNTTVNAFTDTSGVYSVTPASFSCTITSNFTGPYCNVQRADGAANANFSKSGVGDGNVINIAWTTSNSQDSERDAYYHVNLAHDWVKGIDPSLTAIDYSLTTYVNWNDGLECDADWDPVANALNFWVAGATCPNTATIPDIIWHEYGHMVNYNLYFANGATNGLTNGPLAEGLADGFTELLGDEPIVGNGFLGPGTYLRDARVLAAYPQDLVADKHESGLILGGAIWDLRNAIGNTNASRLTHFAKYGLPDDDDAGVAFSEYFIDLLVADDNDADLSNLTPNFTAINTAFSTHGIGMNYFLSLAHTRLDDQPTNGPYPITVNATYGGPVGGLGTAKLFYTINNTPYTSQTMLPTGNPDEYGAEIPNTSYGVVRYYIQVTDSYGGIKTLPGGAPASGTFDYVAGPAITMAFNNMESNDGWTVPTNIDLPIATSGNWVRAAPVGSFAQIGSNHTAGGTQCWITGNAGAGDPPGTNDIDGGHTTLLSTTFNALAGGYINPILSYWKYYSANLGDSPDEDPWRVYLSGDGGTTWKRIENTVRSTVGWQRVLFKISDQMTPTATMRMRFVAQDTLNPSLVEAGVDDWALYGYSPVLGVDPPQAGVELALRPAFPNPARGATQFAYSLPAAGDVRLAVFDVEGRHVRTLVDGERPAGAHSVAWNGRDDAGRLLAAGPYYVRLARGGTVLSRAVVLLR